METIEERAKVVGTLSQFRSDYPYDKRSIMVGYIKGATDQKDIDEEVRLKKCDDMTEAEYNRETAFVDWYNKHGEGAPTYSDAIEWARRELLNDVCSLLREMVECGVRPQSAYGFADRFRRALEEQL